VLRNNVARGSYIPAPLDFREHVSALAASGHIYESFTGPVLTDLGARLLAGEMGKKDASEQTPRAP
jgi:hypothetical protein